jgi:hypothetical protein
LTLKRVSEVLDLNYELKWLYLFSINQSMNA